MKSLFRFLSLGTLALAFTAVGATNSFAQAADVCGDAEIPTKTAKYEEFTKNYAGKTSAELKIALNAAKEYVEKYGACPTDKDQITYFKDYIPKAEKILADTIKYENDLIDAAKTKPLYDRFDAALKIKNWDELYTVGKELLTIEKDPTKNLDTIIVMGLIGLDETLEKKNTKYNADTVKYATMAIQQIEGGTTSKTYGVALKGAPYALANKKFPDAKANALGELNYVIGYIKYNGDKNEKDALPYLYKATQYNSRVKDLPNIYQGIGSYFYTELQKLEEKRVAALKAANGVESEEAKATYALQKGYAERAFDGYAKAYNLVPADPKQKAYKDGLYETLKSIYLFRNNGKSEGIDPAIVSAKSKPLVNPATEVTPIVEAPTTETTTPATDTTGATKPTATTTAPAATKPATAPATTKPTASPTKPSEATATKPSAATASATVKTPVKKTAPKKKGTR